MDNLKQKIGNLSLLERIALATRLMNQINSEATAIKDNDILFFEGGETDGLSDWMWQEAEKSYKKFKESGNKGLSWEEVKAMGNNRKSA